MQYLKDLIKNYIGPALFASVIILGWWAWNDIKAKEAGIEALVQQTQDLSSVLANQCKTVLERQGFTVEKAVKAEAEAEK